MSQTTLLLNLKFFNTSTSPRKTSSLRSLTIHTSFEWQIKMSLVIKRGNHDTTDSREKIFLGSVQLFHSRTICSRHGVVVGRVDSDTLSALAQCDCIAVCAAFLTAGTRSGFHGGSFPSSSYSLITQTIGCVIAALRRFFLFSATSIRTT